MATDMTLVGIWFDCAMLAQLWRATYNVRGEGNPIFMLSFYKCLFIC